MFPRPHPEALTDELDRHDIVPRVIILPFLNGGTTTGSGLEFQAGPIAQRL
jgi:hypothetical protein